MQMQTRRMMRDANRARQDACQREQDRMLNARWLLRDLPPPDREASKRWVRLGTRHEEGVVYFETERCLRTLDRATDATIIRRSRGPELAAAITLIHAPMLRSLPLLAQIPGGVMVPPLARIAEALDAEPEVLGQMLYDEALAEDTEAVRQLLRGGLPLVLPSSSLT